MAIGGATRLGRGIAAQINEPSTSDLPGLRARGFIRVLTTHNRTNFCIESGQGRCLGFEATRLDPMTRNPAGVRGVMQLMSDTGAEMGVRDMHDAEQNTQGNVRDMQKLRESCFNDPAIAPIEQEKVAPAGYTAGPNRINRLRQEAVVQRRAGSEPVRHASDIFATCAMYTMATDPLQDRADELEAVREVLGK